MRLCTFCLFLFYLYVICLFILFCDASFYDIWSWGALGLSRARHGVPLRVFTYFVVFLRYLFVYFVLFLFFLLLAFAIK